MLVVMSCLSSCAPANCDLATIMPVFPKAGIKVADELETLSMQDYPHLWEWLGRVNKLRLELEN